MLDLSTKMVGRHTEIPWSSSVAWHLSLDCGGLVSMLCSLELGERGVMQRGSTVVSNIWEILQKLVGYNFHSEESLSCLDCWFDCMFIKLCRFLTEINIPQDKSYVIFGTFSSTWHQFKSKQGISKCPCIILSFSHFWSPHF